MLYIQLIGILAFCVGVLAYYKKTTEKILIYQSTANFAYFIHYFLLGALSGAFLSIIGSIRNILFIKTKNKTLVAILIIVLYLIVTIIFYENIYSIFPMCANILYLLFLLKDNRKSILIGGTLNSMFWVLYALAVSSYACALTESIYIISNTMQLIRLKKIRN